MLGRARPEMCGCTNAWLPALPQAGRSNMPPPHAAGAVFPRTRRSRSSVTRLCQPSGGSIAIDLQSGDAQARDPMGLNRALPSEEFLYRQFVAAANFLKR